MGHLEKIAELKVMCARSKAFALGTSLAVDMYPLAHVSVRLPPSASLCPVMVDSRIATAQARGLRDQHSSQCSTTRMTYEKTFERTSVVLG